AARAYAERDGQRPAVVRERQGVRSSVRLGSPDELGLLAADVVGADHVVEAHRDVGDVAVDENLTWTPSHPVLPDDVAGSDVDLRERAWSVLHGPFVRRVEILAVGRHPDGMRMRAHVVTGL